MNFVKTALNSLISLCFPGKMGKSCCDLLKHVKYMETEGKNSLNISFMGIKKSHFV